ncbi:MBOAT family protein [Peptostreptococcus anaerobius]|uniref:MBOAT family protein n=1 Tax=Peptostreptococcus porci TaxID=2652282 RepID=A0A6N7XHF8_9FIRM|nr:MBOAT family O-acyltransferase [Peptostreptococcus porci]MST62814.1 MBOAT family protein [Peptostreptococcus porci]
MSFTSLIYLFLFFPIAIAIHTISPKKVKNNVLLLLSLFFYSWGDPRYLILILFSVAITWFGVNRMYAIKNRREEAKFYMVCLIVLNVAILAFYKYYGFLIDNVNAIFRTSLSIIDLPLPFGISFYTFKIISYIADVYTRRTKPQKSFLDFALYVTIFPQIGAGPIVQYADMEKELVARKLSVDKFGFGVEKFIFGLGKKVLIANNMALIWAQVKGMPNLEMSSLTAWIGIVAFTLQIYFDFSGYSDMAIGVGYMLGFKWEENFNYPYISKSATEFWRRWHISLGNWFKRYIYFPLGGSKCSPAMQFRNIFVVWMVTGLWHGANWNFIIWGLYFGIIIYLEKTVLANVMSKLGSKIKTVYCLLIVVFGWVLFDFQSVTQILKFYSNLFVLGANGVVDSTAIYLLRTNWKIIVPAIIGSTPFALKLIDNVKHRFGRNGYFFVSIFYIVIIVLSVASLVGESYSPFLYFKF